MARDYVYTSVRIDLDDVIDEISTEALIAELKSRKRHDDATAIEASKNLADDLAQAVMDGDWPAAQSFARLHQDKKFFERQIKTYKQVKAQA